MGPLALVLVVGFPGEVSLAVTEDVGADLELRLVERLLDQGLRVLPDLSQASIEVVVDRARDEEAFVVSLKSQTSTTVAIPAHPTRLRELELIQRVVVLVQQATAESSEATSTPAVVVPVSSALAPGPRRDLIASLRNDGFGLTQEPREGDIALCVQLVGEQLSVGAANWPEACVARRKTELRSIDDAAANAILQARTVASDDDGDLQSRPPPRIGLSAFGGMMGRSLRGVDPVAGAEIRVGSPVGWSLSLDGMLIPASNDDVSVLETSFTVGPELGIGFGERTRLTVAVRAGVNLHAYDLEDDASGLEADFVAQLPATLSWRAFSATRVGLLVAPGFTHRARRHLRSGSTLWESQPFRFIAGLSLSHDLEL